MNTQRYHTFKNLSRAVGFTLLASLVISCGGSSSSNSQTTDNAGTNGTGDSQTTNNAGTNGTGDSQTTGNNSGDSSTSTPVDIAVLVSNSTDVPLANINVTIDGQAATTDADGLATVTLDKSTTPSIIDIVQTGYVRQSLSFTPDGDKTLQAKLLPVAHSVEVQDIAIAQTISVGELGATVSIPESSLIKESDGTPATGAATIEITPWDITGNDLRAMPANAQAIDSDGNAVELISAGMMTINFYDASNKALQLDSGKTATIQMDLPLASINNKALSVGDSIPLWYYDEAEGIWKEEGTGMVIASSTSPSGLAVTADVAHFSTWNWDFKFTNPGTVDIECKLSDNTAVPCNIVADVVLPDSSRFVKNGYVPASGLTVINMPNPATINWTGTTTTGLMGTATSTTLGQVTITIQAPTTSNFVQCQLPNGSSVDCDVDITDTTNGGTKTVVIPAPGATIETTFNTNSLQWTARTSGIISGNQIIGYGGTTTSAATGNVTISLSGNVPIAQTMQVDCVDQNGNQIDCALDVVETLADGTTSTNTYPTRQSTDITLDNNMVSYQLTGKALGLANGRFYEYTSTLIGTQAQDVTLQLNATDAGPAATSFDVILSGATLPQCNLFAEFGNEDYYESSTFKPSDSVTVQVPSNIDVNANIYVSATCSNDSNSSDFEYGGAEVSYRSISQGQVIPIEIFQEPR